MPRRAGSACTRRGCSGIVHDGVCTVCGPRVKQWRQATDERRGSYRDRGYNAKWDRVREQYINAHPMCERCLEENRVTMAAIVHHIVPLVDGGALLDEANMMAVCTRCHGAIHAELDRAKAND